MFDALPDPPPLSLAVRYPPTWRAESVRWAQLRGLTQGQVDSIEADLLVFRRIRDEFAGRIQERAA